MASKECRDEITQIDSHSLLLTVEEYLRKHRSAGLMHACTIYSPQCFVMNVTLTLTLDHFILHTIVHHSSTSTYMPNYVMAPRRPWRIILHIIT